MLAPGTESVPLQRLAELVTPAGWTTTPEVEPGSDAPLTDIVLGTAGVVLAAVWAGGEHAESIATTGGEALLRAADQTEAGLDWGMVPACAIRGPNYSHGTAGIAAALADSRGRFAAPGLRRSRPPGRPAPAGRGLAGRRRVHRPAHHPARHPQRVEPVTYTWCHGPAGTSYLFAALAHAGVAEVAGLGVDRAAAAMPELDPRLRCPAAAPPRILGQRRPLLRHRRRRGRAARRRPGLPGPGAGCDAAGAARTMGDALVERAIRDEDGARWRFLEHRQDPPLLPPGTSWMQGAAGIAAFLLRLARVIEDGPGRRRRRPSRPVVGRPRTSDYSRTTRCSRPDGGSYDVGHQSLISVTRPPSTATNRIAVTVPSPSTSASMRATPPVASP